MRNVTTYLFIFIISTLPFRSAFAQRSISGRVTDGEDGKPLPGATIKAGEIRGTQTDGSGNFSLKNIAENIAVLEVSYIGYQTQKLPLSSENQLK